MEKLTLDEEKLLQKLLRDGNVSLNRTIDEERGNQKSVLFVFDGADDRDRFWKWWTTPGCQNLREHDTLVVDSRESSFNVYVTNDTR